MAPTAWLDGIMGMASLCHSFSASSLSFPHLPQGLACGAGGSRIAQGSNA